MNNKKDIVSFCFFDFANSAYTTVIITAVYSVFFVKSIGSAYLWSFTLSLSYLAVILISPPAGAAADYNNNKKTYLFISTITCVIATALLFFSSSENIIFTCLMIIISNIGFSLSEIFISSFLPEISTKQNIGRISGYAWGLGYIGGIISLIVSLIFLINYNYSVNSLRLIPIITAFFFLIFSLPSFIFLKEKTKSVNEQLNIFTKGYKKLFNTYKDIKNYNELLKFLTAHFFYSCGIATVISFAAIFAQQVLEFSSEEIIILIIVANISSAVGAIIFGFFQDKIGPKKTLIITLYIWLISVLSVFFVYEKKYFWITANLVGIAIGSSQSSARTLVGLFSPPKKNGEFYGFWGFAGKAASIFGLFSFGILLKLFNNNMRFSVLFTSLFFLIGIIILYFVNEKKGIQK